MHRETYTPGQSQNVTSFMSARTFESHGQFFADYLDSTHQLLDVGCGPGTITVGLAEQVDSVQAIDFDASQTKTAIQNATDANLSNVSFVTGSCYELPFEDRSFDVVFSHALLEHLSDPVKALKEFFRVLKPKGRVGACSPDFGGRMMIPPSIEVERAADAYAQLQSDNGGDLYAGRKLGKYLIEAGFENIELQARYECYPTAEFISEYLALQLEQAKMPHHAAVLREWSGLTPSLFAQTWVSAVGLKP